MQKSQATEVIEEQKPEVVRSEKELGSPNADKVSIREDEAEPVPHLHAKTFLTLFAICLICFAEVINVVGAGSRARDIAIVVGGSSNTVWLTSSVTILTVVLSPPVSQASDYWGRRWFLIVLTLCGSVGSVIVARAKSMRMAIAGEVVTGLSYGAQPLLHAISSEVLPRKYRPYGQALDNLAGALSGLTAILVGGAMTRHGNHAGFRNYWYMSTAFYTIAAVICFLLYNPPVRESQMGLTNWEKIRKLDWIGYALLATGLVLFCMGLVWSQNPYPWTNAHVLAPFLIGVVLIACLVLYETRFKKDGMFHHGLFSRGWNFVIALICLFAEGLAFFAANNYFSYELIVLYNTDPLTTGVRYGISSMVYAVVTCLAGAFCSITKRIRYPTALAFSFTTTFFICMATATPGSSTAVWAYPVFLGMGLGICLCALVTVAQLSTTPELIAIASGLTISVRSFGGSVGLAVFNAIYTSKYGGSISPKIAAAALPLGLPSTSLPALIEGLTSANSTAIAAVPGITPEIISAATGGLLEAHAIGFRYVWVTAGCFSATAAICALFLVDPTKEFNMHIDAPAENEKELFS